MWKKFCDLPVWKNSAEEIFTIEAVNRKNKFRKKLFRKNFFRNRFFP